MKPQDQYYVVTNPTDPVEQDCQTLPSSIAEVAVENPKELFRQILRIDRKNTKKPRQIRRDSSENS